MALSSPKSLDPGGAGGGSCTDPSISSSLGNVADQSGAYAPTLTHDGASVATAAVDINTGLPVVVTGSATTTPSVPEPTAGHALLVTHTTTAADGLTDLLPRVVMKAAAPSGASWTDVYDVDFTTDITDKTITIDAAASDLYEADGTTVKASVYTDTRFGSPSTESAVITAAAGGFRIQCGGANDALVGGVVISAAAVGLDFDDPRQDIAVYVVVEGQSFAQDNDSLFVGIGPDQNVRNGGDGSFGLQQKRNSSTAYIRRGVQSISGSSTSDSDQDSQTSARADLVACFVIRGGRAVDALSVVGTTIPDGVPEVTGTTIRSPLNYTNTVGAEGPFSTQICVGVDVFTAGGSTAEATITRILIRTLDLS